MIYNKALERFLCKAKQFVEKGESWSQGWLKTEKNRNLNHILQKNLVPVRFASRSVMLLKPPTMAALNAGKANQKRPPWLSQAPGTSPGITSLRQSRITNDKSARSSLLSHDWVTTGSLGLALRVDTCL